MEAIKDNEYGHNLIATTRINQSNKPTKKDFEDAEVLVMNFASWDNKPNVKWYLPIRHKHIPHLIETIDSLEVQKNYDINSSMFGFVADFDINIIEATDKQIKSEETKPRSKTKQTIKELIKNKSRWKLW